MAPLDDPSGAMTQRWKADVTNTLRTTDRRRRERKRAGNGSTDNTDSNRFGFGNNRDGSGNNGGGGDGGGGGGGGGGFFRGGGFGNGNRFGGGNGNGNDNKNNNFGNGGRFGGGNNNDGKGGDFSAGRNRFGGNRGGFGNRFGNGDGGGGNGGGGFGRGGNNNNGGGDTSSTSATTSVETTSPDDTAQETPTTTTTPTEAISSGVVTSAPEAVNQGVILLQSATPTSEIDSAAATSMPIIQPSSAAGKVDDPDFGDKDLGSAAASSTTQGPSLAPLPSNPSTGGPMGNIPPNNNQTLEAAQSGMDPMIQHILVAVGSIGGFILISFISWVVWRTLKRSRKPRYPDDSKDMSKLSFLGERGWQPLGDPRASQQSMHHEKAPLGRNTPLPSGDFDERDQTQGQQPPTQPWPLATPELMISSGRGSAHSGVTYQQRPNPEDTQTLVTRPQITVMTDLPAVYSHQAQGSFSSTNAAQFGATVMTDHTASPLYSRASPASYYTQPFLGPQFGNSDNADPLHRQASNATSELSSGFGDGDIIVTDAVISPPAPTADPSSATNSPQTQYTARFSWMTHTQGSQPQPKPQAQAQTRASFLRGPFRQNSSAGSAFRINANGDRESIYTTSSEDLPARFRSVSSWVNQQTGRIRRVQQRQRQNEGGIAAEGASPVVEGAQRGSQGNEPGIPGIHNPPQEPSFGFMMEDGEKPRRVEEVVVDEGRSK
ncbi:hypothetical protein B0J18DRAFT_188267 [Chaetomium sp. MPI-SDFR-AT-0129]|nr:hypothetical protein B0J18DRAFT_188267 [Chaetomium sp. MPI-SDFR-AT-0129]